MSHLDTRPEAASDASSALRNLLRWLLTFAGFPLGGVAAMVLTGPVDDLAAAIGGGLATGAVLGLVQSWGLRVGRRFAVRWVAATVVGLSTGLAVGGSLVDFRTGLGDLVVQGAVSGLAVGAAQGVVLWSRLGRFAFGWPAYLAATWALGWAVTTAIGVRVDEQFTVFGSAGALTVALLTAVLPLQLARTATTANEHQS
ncbi:hypothetical protein [Nocardioides sp. GXQ0305]|uniref:hypothetical protein n=1 Tax=Nocardioides sp. GXQ0305 TaxID=3423912 RepID=UPI003D7E255E